MNDRVFNPQHSASKVYTMRPTGRGLRMDGYPFQINADNLREAIRAARRHFSRAWGLRLIRVEDTVNG